ncbi:MAG: methionyl-tRNA formyltransferase [Deltaproteobacteria bacterium]|nr:methionyl-tRNA formyltransferase [Deltaproteobacteria bacterium]
MKNVPKILFMGTPEFAVPTLENLLKEAYPVIGVVTQPDRPKGRGKALAAPPVKIFAQEKGLTVLQPERVREEAFLKKFRILAPDMVVLVAFGQILPKAIIDFPQMGCLNVHPSLLPKYRGAAPMNWSLIRGETKTGVTIILMGEGVDSGDILLQEETSIGSEETFETLHDRLAVLGADLLVRTIEMIVEGNARRVPQDHSQATFAPRLKKEDGLINWSKTVADIVNLIRGLSPQPGAYTYLDGKKLKILNAVGEETAKGGLPGKIAAATEKGLPVQAKDGIVYLQDVQLENKKRMPVGNFLRGYRIAPGTVLE